jgi:hypothetical protein
MATIAIVNLLFAIRMASIYFRDDRIFAKGQESEALTYAAEENDRRIARIADLKG